MISVSIISIFPFVTALLVLLLGGLTLSRNSKSAINRSFFFLTLSAFTWLIFESLAYVSVEKFHADILMRLSYVGVINIATTLFHFVSEFLRLNKVRKVVFVVYLMGLGFSYASCASSLLIADVRMYPWGYYPIAGRLHPFFLLFFVTVIISSIMLLWIALVRPKFNLTSRDRDQIKYVLLGIFIFNFASLDFVPNYNVVVVPLGFIPTFFFLSIITYSILKFRLMDITLVITRTTIFVVVYMAVLGIPYAVAFGAGGFLFRMFGVNWWVFPLTLLTILATAGPFLYLFFNRKAEEKLLRDQKDYQKVLINASKGMIRIKNLDRLLRLVVHVLTKTVKIKYAAIYLLDLGQEYFFLSAQRGVSLRKNVVSKVQISSLLVSVLTDSRGPVLVEEWRLRQRENFRDAALQGMVQTLTLLDATVVVPSFLENKLIGLLVLGDKKSERSYSEGDLAVFSVLANQAALAIENAQFYEEIKKTHEQLFQAEKLATIGTMADGLSHQINNRFHVLSLIAGDSLDILKHLQVDGCSEGVKKELGHIQQSLEKIEQNVLQGGEIVKGLLKYSRPGQEGFQSLDLRTVVNGAMDMVQYKIKIRDIDIVVQIPNDLPKFMGNLTQLQEVFFNLVDNAYDATVERAGSLNEPGYRGRIQITASGEEGSLHVLVADNGIGVKDFDKKKMFTPFFTTKATSRKGTGLGLYVIEKILASHQGKIEIDSVYQRGTVFSIFLPWGQNILTS